MTDRLGRGPVNDTIGLEARNNAVAKIDAGEDLVRCAGCGALGRWIGSAVVNPGPDEAPPTCPGHRRRQHGPWIPVGPLDTLGQALQRAAAENA